jgi:transglutaminase-like putative cysteine protease
MFIIMNLLFVSVYAEEAKYSETNGVKLYPIGDTQVQGFVDIQGETTNSKIKLMVVRNNEQLWYDVKVDKGMFSQQLWLNNGKGEYTVHVMVNEYDRKYSFGPNITIENIKEMNPLLSPEKYIESADKQVIEKAVEITKNLTSDREKAKEIYNWVSKNIDYDYEKYNKHLNNDYNNEYGALLALDTKKGVCYDYAALVAALGRASGMQTKVVKGTGKVNGTSGYHAWNEIYIADESKWIKLDATFAAVADENYFDRADFDKSHIEE